MTGRFTVCCLRASGRFGIGYGVDVAGLRGIDQDVWKAARVDGISTWKTYIFIVLPAVRPIFVTAVVLVATGIIKSLTLLAQTDGGPGLSTSTGKYVYDMMFNSQNLGQGFAASTTMLLVVLVIIIPWSFYEFGADVMQNDMIGPRARSQVYF